MNTLHTALLLTHGVSTSQIKDNFLLTYYYYYEYTGLQYMLAVVESVDVFIYFRVIVFQYW